MNILSVTNERLLKDAVLDSVSELANVAQFISFDPQANQRYARIRGFAPNHTFESAQKGIEALLGASPDKSVNVRSFSPDNPKSREFIYGLRSTDEAWATVSRLAM